MIFFLQSPDSDWQKVDYLMEFGEWLFVNEYPVEDAVDQVNSTFLNLNGAKSEPPCTTSYFALPLLLLY